MENSELPEVIKKLIEVVNRRDTESFLAFFPVDGVVNDWGKKYVGHAGIRSWSDREFIGAKVSLVVTSSEQQKRPHKYLRAGRWRGLQRSKPVYVLAA